MVKWFQWVLVCGLCGLAAGCGGDGVTVEGKVTKGGAAYTPPDGDRIIITMTSEDNKHTVAGDVNADGSFRVKSSTGGGVPVGKYKVSFTHYTAAVGGKGGGSPVTRQVPESWDVTPTAKTFTLDIATPAKK